MPRGKTLQTLVPGFGRIYRPSYRDKKTGELKHSGIWWMEYRTSGGPVYRSTKQRDQEAAYAELLRQAGRAGHGEISDATPERVTFGRLLDLLIADYEHHKRASTGTLRMRVETHLRPVFGAKKVIELRKSDIEKFKRRILDSGRSAATVNRCLSALRRAMQLGADEDPPLVVRHIPRWFGKLDESEGVRSGIITPEMYEKLKPAFIAPHARLAFVTGYHTGLRLGAILGLRWDWADLDKRVIRIPVSADTLATKRKPRVVPVYGDMLALMQMAWTARQNDERARKCPYVIQEHGRPVESVKTAWYAAFERAGLLVDSGKRNRKGEPLMKPAALFHDLRRTAATMLHEAGFEMAAIMDICGWKSLAMPKRYIQQTVRHVQEIGRRMEQFLGEQRAQRAKTHPGGEPAIQ